MIQSYLLCTTSQIDVNRVNCKSAACSACCHSRPVEAVNPHHPQYVSLLLFVTPVCPVVLCVCVKHHLSKETMEALRLPTFDAWQWEPNEVRLIH